MIIDADGYDDGQYELKCIVEPVFALVDSS